MDQYGGIRGRFQQRLHVGAARSPAAAEGEREEHAAAVPGATAAAHALQHHVVVLVPLPQIGQLLHHHLLRRRRGFRAAAADLVLPEPRRQQRRLVVQPPKLLLLHPLRLPAAVGCLPAGEVSPGGRWQAAEHLVEELVVYSAGADGRAELVEGDLAGGSHGLHFPRRGLHRR